MLTLLCEIDSEKERSAGRHKVVLQFTDYNTAAAMQRIKNVTASPVCSTVRQDSDNSLAGRRTMYDDSNVFTLLLLVLNVVNESLRQAK